MLNLRDPVRGAHFRARGGTRTIEGSDGGDRRRLDEVARSRTAEQQIAMASDTKGTPIATRTFLRVYPEPTAHPVLCRRELDWDDVPTMAHNDEGQIRIVSAERRVGKADPWIVSSF